VLVIHRVGTLAPTDQIVLVVVTGARIAARLRCLPLPHGLSQDPRTVLEKETRRKARWSRRPGQ
jgi:hypothetical protein